MFHYLREAGKLDVWYRIKDELIAERGYRCEICGFDGDGLFLHEKWKYNNKKHIQYLEDLQLLCYNCHQIKHFDMVYSYVFTDENSFKYPFLVEHFCKVNNCSRIDFELYFRKEKEMYYKRSWYKRFRRLEKPVFVECGFGGYIRMRTNEKVWKQDFGELGEYVLGERLVTEGIRFVEDE